MARSVRMKARLPSRKRLQFGSQEWLIYLAGCSTSRAYYGVFHIARKLLDFSENTTHGEVIEAVKSDNWTLGTKLEDLFKKRKNADYKLSRTNFDKPYAYYHIEECKDVVRKIKKLYTKID